MLPGLRLRQARERLGLTYRDVERASFELAARRGRPELILHISRLADIENRDVTPGLHKLYTLAVVYHLNPLEIFRWYDVPIEGCFPDGGAFHAPHTHLAAPPYPLRLLCDLTRHSIQDVLSCFRAWSSSGAISKAC
jgi:transcriptional regulator with XRE-family HTH domain